MIDLDRISIESLPIEMAVSALTLAELAAGPHLSSDAQERARRQDRLERTGRGRVIGLMVAATAVAAGVPLFTRNAADLAGLDSVLETIAV